MSEDFRFPRRIAGLRELLAKESLGGVIVSLLENARYLTGFTGSNALALLTPEAAVFFTDGRYGTQSAAEVPGFERVVLASSGSSLAEAAGEQVQKLGLKRVAFEEAYLTVKEFHNLREKMPEGVELVGKSGLVESLRLVKDVDEIAAIRRAVALADACFDHIRENTRPGVTEKELAWEIEVFLRQRGGAQRLAFDTIVASGPNSALPHAKPTDRRLGESGGPEFVTFDYGAVVDGYCSDITRTLLIGGPPTPRHREVYDTVLRVQLAALAAINPGVKGKDVDSLARDLFTQAGFGENFPHGLGHALGRVVHDGMGFSQRSEITVAPGMVLTVEPGVYFEGWGGVRIEDDIVVTDAGCEILTRSPKELILAGIK